MTVAAASSSPFATFRIIASDIKLAHSVFALPFAVLAAFMAALGPTRGTYFVGDGIGEVAETWTRHPFLHQSYFGQFWPPFAEQLTLIVLAMVFARTFAMLANRLLDRHIDKANPRTSNRAIPSGRLAASHAIVALLICALGFLTVCASFGFLFDNWWPIFLGAPVLLWIGSYGLLKRSTALCHVYLGSSLAISPIAAAIAIMPESIAPWSAVFQPALWLLAGMVLCWVAGFDIIYALQDVDVDREQNLHSMPSRLGMGAAMQVSRVLHVAAVGCLVACWKLDARLGWPFGVGVLVVAALLLYEHLTVARWGTTKIALAFFTLNGAISCLLGALGVIDVLWV